jgi:hypothetical protein
MPIDSHFLALDLAEDKGSPLIAPEFCNGANAQIDGANHGN